mgnify:CR=1 FL=1
MKTSDYFAECARTDGSSVWFINSGAPEWLLPAIIRAHDDEPKNDWRYNTCRRIVVELEQNHLPGENVASDWRHHIVDALQTFTNYEILTWAAENLTRPSYAIDYWEELGNPYANGDRHFFDDPLASLRTAIYQCVRVMVDEMADAWEDAA